MPRNDLTAKYLAALQGVLTEEIEGMTRIAFSDMYSVGRVQGKIDGIKIAIRVLEEVIEDQLEKDRQ